MVLAGRTRNYTTATPLDRELMPIRGRFPSSPHFPHQQSGTAPLEHYQPVKNEDAVPDVSQFGIVRSLLHTLDILDSLMALEDNWDSYGAPRITDAAYKAALELLVKLISINHSSLIRDLGVYPVPTGGIQFEWEIDGIEVEFEINPLGKAHILLCLDDSEDCRESERGNPLSLDDALGFISQESIQLR